jgi:hypothetical protein
MKEPFAYALFIERNSERSVSLYQTMPEAEEALREYSASRFVGLCDDEITEVLAEHGTRVHIYAVTQKRNKQISTELKPFARAMAA